MIILEASDRIEPIRIEGPAGELLDLSLDAVAKAELLGHALHPKTADHLARTVRITNTYYSNLIEGHNARPRDEVYDLLLKLHRPGRFTRMG
jgi:hypothetical protein